MDESGFALFIDCSEDTFERGLEFWPAAFGVEPVSSGDPTDPYVLLPGAIPGLRVHLQRVGAPSRYHIDFPAVDVDAEVERMVALGAERVAQIEYWWVLRAPTGQLFCVVPGEETGSDSATS